MQGAAGVAFKGRVSPGAARWTTSSLGSKWLQGRPSDWRVGRAPAPDDVGASLRPSKGAPRRPRRPLPQVNKCCPSRRVAIVEAAVVASSLSLGVADGR